MINRIILFILILGSATQLYANEGVGSASYYNNKFHGARTASGDRYNKDKLTCAHKDYPFGTQLLITNLQNGKEVIVTVNDRGPYHSKRVIDISYIAAQKIGIIQKGVAQVKFKVVNSIKRPPLTPNQQQLMDGVIYSLFASSPKLLNKPSYQQIQKWL